jgi:N-acetylglucosamine kinase-like BadF-type ATPase
MKKSVAVGVDVGGTWARVVARAPRDKTPRSVKAPAPSLHELPSFLVTLWRRWGLARRDVAALVVASRGVWTRAERAREERRLKRLALRVKVISDVEAAYLGALGERPGIVVIAGTGSIVLGRNSRGRLERTGGLGPLLGDEGSAFWIGKEWLRVTNPTRARTIARAPDAVARIAALSPGVLREARRGNPLARSIVRDAQRHLATLAVRTARSLKLEGLVAVSWGGSLLGNPAFRNGFARSLRRSGLKVLPVKPRESPALAASRLALALLRADW